VRAKEMEVFYKDLIYNKCNMGEVTNKDVYKNLIDLFKRHPEFEEKKGTGIQKIFIHQNKLNKKAREIYIERIDGSVVVISWRTCLSGLGKSNKALTLQAMRSAIHNQITDFKKAQKQVCNNCPSICDLEVDHTGSVVFSDMADLFLKNKILPSDFSYDKFGRVSFKDVDKELQESWEAYHKFYATLQLLCKNCHIKKTRGY